MSRLLLSTLALVLLFSLSCKKNNSDDPPAGDIPTRTIQGSVVLPEGVGAPSGWAVTSAFSEGQVSGSGYETRVAANDVDFQFVTDAGGREMLMGISYPGQTDFTINTASTVVALALATPLSASLSVTGRQNLIATVRNHPKFSEAEQVLIASLQSGKGLLDSTNLELLVKLGELIDAAAQKTTTHEPNVNIFTAGKLIQFQNPGHGFNQVVGVYYQGKQIHEYNLERYKFMPNSISELIVGHFNPQEPIETPQIELKDPGEYDIRIRTGRPGTGFTDQEAMKAFIWNVTEASVEMLELVAKLPLDNTACRYELRDLLYDEVAATSTNALEKMATAEYITSLAFKAIFALSIHAQQPHAFDCWVAKKTFIGKVGKMLAWADPVSKFSSMWNQSRFINGWLRQPAAVDTCFMMKDNNLRRCGAVDVSFTPGYFNPGFTAQSFSFDMDMAPDSAWTITSDQSWCSLNKTSGTGDATIGITVTENSSATTPRGANIIVRINGNVPETLKVVQQPVNIGLTLTPNQFNVGKEGTVRTFNISMIPELTWTGVAGVTWLHFTPTTWTGNQSVVLTIDPNTGTSARTGVVVISLPGYNKSAVLTVNQSATGSAGIVGLWYYDKSEDMDSGDPQNINDGSFIEFEADGKWKEDWKASPNPHSSGYYTFNAATNKLTIWEGTDTTEYNIQTLTTNELIMDDTDDKYWLHR